MYEIGSELSVPKAFFRHVGVYTENGYVFHNHPIHGEQLITLKEFSGGRAITVTKLGVSDQISFRNRLNAAISSPRPYRLLLNNCEHTVSRLRTEESETPQVLFWGATFILSGIAIWATARARS